MFQLFKLNPETAEKRTKNISTKPKGLAWACVLQLLLGLFFQFAQVPEIF